MKFALLLANMLIASISGLAQTQFQRLYIGSGGGQLLELPDGNILTRITHQNGISKLDPDGQIIYTRSYAIDSLLGIASIRQYNDNDLVFVSGFRKDSCSNTGSMVIPFTYPAIGRMTLSGSVHELRHFRLNGSECWGYLMDLEVSNTKDVITWGLAPAFFALRVDSTLTPRWARKFNDQGSFQFIKELPGGDMIAGIIMETAGVVEARMDANGNFLWCKSYIRPRGIVHDVVIESDDSYIITGLTDSTGSTNGLIPLPTSYHPKLFMMKLDGQGSVQWCKGFDSAPNLWYSHSASRIIESVGIGFHAAYTT